MLYADSNLFVYAAAYSGDTGEKAKEFLTRAFSKKQGIAMSTLAIDEIAWKLAKGLGRVKTADICRGLLSNPYIEFIPPTTEIMRKALDLMENFDMDPRGAIHAATCVVHGIKEMVSEDTDFDKLKGIGIKRTSFLK